MDRQKFSAITRDALKQLNMERIFMVLRDSAGISRLDLSRELGLSLPTIAKNLNCLEEKGLILSAGTDNHTGGRSSRLYSISENGRYAFGISITQREISGVAYNLRNTVIARVHYKNAFSRSDETYRLAGQVVSELEKQCGCRKEQVLGVAIVIPGLITPDRATAYYSKVLNIFEPIECSEFARYISYPTVLLHDTGSAAYAEAVFNEEIPSFFYLMVSDSIGGASVINGAVQHGSNCRCGEIGHVHLVKNGRQCYCGLKGCVDPYCSTRVLSQYTGGKLDQFFEVLEAGDQKASDIWNEYLDYLALAIHDIRMLFDGEIVLGGYLGLYIEPYMEDLKKRVIRMDPFIDEADYLKVCKCRLDAAASGGALQYIQNVFQFI